MLPKLPLISEHSIKKVFRHRSLTQGNILPNGVEAIDNERLSFLGNAIIHTCVTRYLFIRFPLEKIGFLSLVRTNFVSKEKIASWSRYYELNRRLEATAYLAVENIPSAQIDVFQAYIGAMSMDLPFDEVQAFISLLLDAEPESSFQPASGVIMKSISDASGTIKGEGGEVGSPPLYTRSSETPLGAPPLDLDTSSASEQGDGMSTTSPSSPTAITGFTVPTSVPPQSPKRMTPLLPSGAPLPPPPPSKGGLSKSYLSYFNELCTQRSQLVSWDFTAVGPAHDRVWEAKLTHQGVAIGRGVAKGKQEAKNNAAWQALLTLKWPLPT